MRTKLKSLGWVGLYMAILLGCSIALSVLLMVAVLVVGIKNGMAGDGAVMERMLEQTADSITRGGPLLILNGALDLILLAGFGLWYYFREKKNGFYPDYRKVFTAKNILCIAGIAFLGQYALNIVISLMYVAAPGLWEDYMDLEQNFHVENSSPAVVFITVCLVGPVVEEIMFRGMIYGRLRRGFSMVPAMFISALLFGVFHMNWVQGVYAGIAGLALAYIYEKTQTIWAGCLMHIIFNSSSYITDALDKLLGNLGIVIPDIVFLGFSLACVAIVWVLLLHFRGKPIPGRVRNVTGIPEEKRQEECGVTT